MKIYFMDEETGKSFMEMDTDALDVIPRKGDYIEMNGRGFKVKRLVFFLPLHKSLEIWCKESAE